MLRVLVNVTAYEESFTFGLPPLYFFKRSSFVMLTLNTFDRTGTRVREDEGELGWVMMNQVLN